MLDSNSNEQKMIKLYNSLSEKDRRRYAAIEAFKIGRGGISYISHLFGCSRNTISKGIEELQTFDEKLFTEQRIRKPGGGRKKIFQTLTNLDENFLLVLKNYTAGDPMNEQIKWTHLTQEQIASALKEQGIKVSLFVIRQLLKKHSYVKRKAQKKQTTGANPLRNEQFENLAALETEYEATGNPIISFDSKKKEMIGNLYRDLLSILPKPLQL